MTARPDARARWALGSAYAAALAVAVLIVGLGDGPLWWRIGVADVVATLVVFGFSYARDNSSLYDPYWSVAPMVIAPYLLTQAEGAVPLRQGLVLGLVLGWGARLTFNWWRQWRGLDHEDWRYRDLRARTGRAYWGVSLLGIHLFPTVLVFGGCLSLHPALVDGTRALGVLDLLGALVTATGIWFEATADRQLHAFVRSGPPPTAILETGLWARCRHPNYFGEITFWWGLAILGLAADPSAWWILAGPVSITALFLFVSLPMIERRMALRRPGWPAHAARVPRLLPRLLPRRLP